MIILSIWLRIYVLILVGYILYFLLFISGLIVTVYGGIQYLSPVFKDLCDKEADLENSKFNDLKDTISWMIWIKLGPLSIFTCCTCCSIFVAIHSRLSNNDNKTRIERGGGSIHYNTEAESSERISNEIY